MLIQTENPAQKLQQLKVMLIFDLCMNNKSTYLMLKTVKTKVGNNIIMFL